MNKQNPQEGSSEPKSKTKSSQPYFCMAELSPSVLLKKNRSLREISEAVVSISISYIQTHGVCPPIIIDENNNVLAGDEWAAAALQLKLKTIGAMRVCGLPSELKKTLAVGYYRILEKTDWNVSALKDTLQEVYEVLPEFDFNCIAFSNAEFDAIVFSTSAVLNEDSISEPEISLKAISQLGDVWILGDHRLLNGSATEPDSYKKLIHELKVRTIISDPPFNVKTQGHMGGGGKIKHREFLQAAGEMSETEFTEFLQAFLRHSCPYVIDGGLVYVFMDFRHMREILGASANLGIMFLTLCVWCKNNGGMGSFYRSQHELIFVFRVGKKSHINNIELGKNGRYRTNVWDYPGVNTFKKDRMDELSMHPTVKPVAMIADAILDASKCGEYILDCFVGSGTIFIACEKTGRKGLGIELDPLYVDVAIRRWQKWTGKKAVHEASGKTFDEIAAENNSPPLLLPVPQKRKREGRNGGKDV